MNEMKPEDVYFHLEQYPESRLKRNALALLREKDAEIERLKEETHRFADIGKMYSEIRAEAITEFAERLKTFYNRLPGKTVGGSVEYHIEQIAKEMREK